MSEAPSHPLPPPVLATATPPRWLEVALADFDAVLIDHALCEKKAAASAMALVSTYPDLDDLVRAMTRLAQEELRHFRQVHELLMERGLRLAFDRGDPYAQELLRCVRTGRRQRRTDRLLVSSLIEARSCERLALLAEGLDEPSLRRFYGTLAGAEAGHYRLFVDLARKYDELGEVDARLQELAAAEAEIVSALPIAPRVH